MINKKIFKEYSICALKFGICFLLSIFIFKSKRIWLISERGDDARDNGYHFFKYLRKNHPEINCIYVIDKKSVDYKKVFKLGNTVQYGSIQHYLLLFLAEVLISSHIMGFTPCPGFFIGLDKKIKILKGKRIFLQHGIIKDNIEGLKYPVTKLDLFICGAKPEYEYIRENYNYPEGIIQYTGLARYDNLINFKTQKIILLMPTWRKWNNNLSKNEFKKTEYYQKFSDLMSNNLLLNELKKRDYKLIFYPHYEVQKYLSLFTENENIIIADFNNYDVQSLLKEAEILITDYSSVYFDFAYMKKPIIFYQFDKKNFLENHYQKGYIIESDFGFIAYQEKEVIASIKNIFEKKYPIEKYEKNTDIFFKFQDQNNSERIYQHIRKKLKG